MVSTLLARFFSIVTFQGKGMTNEHKTKFYPSKRANLQNFGEQSLLSSESDYTFKTEPAGAPEMLADAVCVLLVEAVVETTRQAGRARASS